MGPPGQRSGRTISWGDVVADSAKTVSSCCPLLVARISKRTVNGHDAVVFGMLGDGVTGDGGEGSGATRGDVGLAAGGRSSHANTAAIVVAKTAMPRRRGRGRIARA